MLEWKISKGLVPYPEAMEIMEQRVADIAAGTAMEMVWLLEHPPLYTSGTSAKPSDLLHARFPVYASGRGGQFTYHGPGQRIAYVMLDLKKRGAMDVRLYVENLEKWIIATLACFGVQAFTREGRIGVWVEDSGFRIQDSESKISSPNPEKKIAALGIRLRKWVSFHGISLNVNPDLSHYNGIVPCGISEYGVTSLAALGIHASMSDVDAALKKEFERIFL